MALSKTTVRMAQAVKPAIERPKMTVGPCRTSCTSCSAKIRSPISQSVCSERAPGKNAREMSTIAPSTGSGVLEELKSLRSLFDAIPFVSQGPSQQPSSEFSFPKGTLFKAPTEEIGLRFAPAYAQALKEHGVAAIEVGFDDPDSKFLLSVVEEMGCKADTHSSSQGALWDVTYKPEGVFSEGTGKSAHSVSHSLGEFQWHTDAAFEKDPMRYFGFHILHPDKMDGGVFRLLRSEELTDLLSPQTVGTLLAHEFDIQVPPEFFKGSHTVKGKLLHMDESTGQVLIRFRKDILPSPPSSNPAVCKAVDELFNLLEDKERVGTDMPSFAFKENTVLLMDNARFLHMRTDIKDPRRHLRRVRFRGNPGGSENTV